MHSTPGRAGRAAGTERLCAATGEVKPIDEMIRFVVGAGRRRGARPQAPAARTRRLDHGNAAGAAKPRSHARHLRAASSATFASRRDLVDMTERLIERAALDALASPTRPAGSAIGFAKAEAALAHGARGRPSSHAADAAPDGVQKARCLRCADARGWAGRLP